LRAEPRIAHHDLCFGCGQANLFGLQLEVSARQGGAVEGRFFVKQDHQGPPGYAHAGVLAAALEEAMALLIHAKGTHATTARLELELLQPARLGTFVGVRATIGADDGGGELQLSARAHAEEGERTLARGRATFVRVG
jgi:acyl-coenzyme A thioesterase PaaI-like protein